MAAREKNFLLEVISRYHESGYLEGRKKILFCTNVHQNSSLQVPSLLHATTGKPAYTYLGSREFSTPPTLSRDTNSKLHKCFCWFVARDLNYSLLTSSINPLKGKKRLKVFKTRSCSFRQKVSDSPVLVQTQAFSTWGTELVLKAELQKRLIKSFYAKRVEKQEYFQ